MFTNTQRVLLFIFIAANVIFFLFLRGGRPSSTSNVAEQLTECQEYLESFEDAYLDNERQWQDTQDILRDFNEYAICDPRPLDECIDQWEDCEERQNTCAWDLIFCEQDTKTVSCANEPECVVDMEVYRDTAKDL